MTAKTQGGKRHREPAFAGWYPWLLAFPSVPIQVPISVHQADAGDYRHLRRVAQAVRYRAMGWRSWRYATALCACAAAEKTNRFSFLRTESQDAI